MPVSLCNARWQTADHKKYALAGISCRDSEEKSTAMIRTCSKDGQKEAEGNSS